MNPEGQYHTVPIRPRRSFIPSIIILFMATCLRHNINTSKAGGNLPHATHKPHAFYIVGLRCKTDRMTDRCAYGTRFSSDCLKYSFAEKSGPL